MVSEFCCLFAYFWPLSRLRVWAYSRIKVSIQPESPPPKPQQVSRLKHPSAFPFGLLWVTLPLPKLQRSVLLLLCTDLHHAMEGIARRTRVSSTITVTVLTRLAHNALSTVSCKRAVMGVYCCQSQAAITTTYTTHWPTGRPLILPSDMLQSTATSPVQVQVVQQ